MKRRFNKSKKLISLDELIKEADVWDRKYLDVVVHSLERYDLGRYDELVREFLSKRNRGAFKLTNPYSKKLWFPALMKSFLDSRRKLYGRSWEEDLGRSKVACALVTFTHEDWACADTNIEFDLCRAKQKVRNALGGTSFIASFDAAVYSNEEWSTKGVSGRLISFHCHAIVWLGSQSGLQRLQKRVQKRFKPILGNKNGMHVKAIKHELGLIRSTRYITKMPLLAYRTEKVSNGKKKQRHTKMTFSSRRNLFHALKGFSTFEFWLAGGEGRSVLRGPRDRLKREYQPACDGGSFRSRYRY